MKAEDLMAKADQALISARVLLNGDDADGACNRAYYAMYDAARAALLLSGHELGKTHRGLLSAFSQHLVKNGPLPRDAGRYLKMAETFRYVADYEGDSVTISDARTMVEQAEAFVTTVRNELMPGSGNKPS